jgi:hypothetical protein
MVQEVRRRRPDLTIRVVDGAEDREALKRHNLTYGPAIVFEGRVEFVGVPTTKMLLARLRLAEEQRAKAAEAAQAAQATQAAPAADPQKDA